MMMMAIDDDDDDDDDVLLTPLLVRTDLIQEDKYRQDFYLHRHYQSDPPTMI